ncbi:M35 family metallo-endopeptidase [Paraburkholderia sp. MPAMCS5]|uniref:M35 family metallo-endopeptidase n=1 Tax=Paraburkholderia sp. MPAMCS5 TaxID=3112563 RepID=UPI002E187F20|nr:M35 family metallo-endopeptidase [Paraburkholderia sp. MPAMCS5]
MPVDDYVHVGNGQANTTEESNQDVFLSLNGPPICPNVPDSEFRKNVLRLRDKAIILVDKRLAELVKWDSEARARVADWFGRSDAATRDCLMSGFPKLKTVLQGLEPKNFLRASLELDRYLGCLPNLKSVKDEIAHVCAPNTATHTICIRENFCILPATDMFGESQLATIIHEATHFTDTFGTLDNMYGLNSYMMIWGRSNPSLAINNADSIAGYVVYGEEKHS